MATWNRNRTRVMDITDSESSDSEDTQPPTRGKIKRTFESPEPPVKRRRIEQCYPTKNLYIAPSTKQRLPLSIHNRAGETVRVSILQNDGNIQTLRELIICKELLAQCLPEMPLSHILKLIMDPRQFTIAIWSNEEEESLMAAVSARPFPDQKFIEVAFLGVRIGSQYQGYGTLIMNYLKEYIKRELKCFYILTFADAAAVGFFEKQGFSSKITLEKRAWQPCIKTYRDAKFMECYIIPEIDYLLTKQILNKRRAEVMQAIHSKTNILKEYPGLKPQKAGKKFLRSILGLTPDEVDRARKETLKVNIRLLRQNAKFAAIIEHLMKKSFSEPFRHPVEIDQAPRYYDVVRIPMDLNQMLQKINSHKYRSEQEFKADFSLIVSNCHLFNGDKADNHWVALVTELHDCFREQYKIQFPPVAKEKKIQAYRSLNRNTFGMNGAMRNIAPRQLSREKLYRAHNPVTLYDMSSGTFSRV